MKVIHAESYTRSGINALKVRGQAEAVPAHKRCAYRARLIAARGELVGTAAAYVDSILRRLDELDHEIACGPLRAAS